MRSAADRSAQKKTCQSYVFLETVEEKERLIFHYDSIIVLYAKFFSHVSMIPQVLFSVYRQWKKERLVSSFSQCHYKLNLCLVACSKLHHMQIFLRWSISLAIAIIIVKGIIWYFLK